MSARRALRSALADTYRCSWRLLFVNSALSAAVSAVVLVVSAFPLTLFLAPLLAGPVAAALVHCTVTVIREEEFKLADVLVGLRRFWRRGFALGGLFGSALLLGALAVSFYTSSEHRILPLAGLAIYVFGVVCLVLLISWPLAIGQPDAPLREALRDAWLLVLRAPLQLFTLGAVLLVVNVVGAVTILPLLTLTIAYSFLAAAYLVLPAPVAEEASR
jgi:hypothetical protein